MAGQFSATLAGLRLDSSQPFEPMSSHSNGTPQLLGMLRERSRQNADEVEELDQVTGELRERLRSVERYAKFHAVTLGVLAAQALGIPTNKLISFLLSIL